MFLILALSLASFTGVALAQGLDGSLTFALPVTAETTWVHYKQREATSSMPGIREYWVACGANTYQFTAPDSDNIKEGLVYDTTGFKDDDPRWIKWVDECKLAFYDASSNELDYSEVTSMSGTYSPVSSLSGDIGSSSRQVYAKDDSSPAYSVMTKYVSQIINSNDDLSTFVSSIEGKQAEGYYVLTADLNSPSAYINNLPSDAYFAGTLDGRGHTITNPVFWGYRLLGRAKGATIKDLNFKDVSVFSILAVYLDSAHIENCTFKAASTLSPYSNIGFLCDYVYSGVSFKDVVIDFGMASSRIEGNNSLVPAIAKANDSMPNNNVTYENVVFRGLNSTEMYLSDYCGHSLRPEEITYESTYSFLKNGSSPYSIAYLSSSAEAKTASSFIQSKVASFTRTTLALSTFDSTSVDDYQESKIYVGDATLASSYGVNVPSEYGSYALFSGGKGLFLFSNDSMGYQAGALKFLNELLGYRYIGDQTETATYVLGSDIDLPYLRLSYSPSFGLRKCDWSDGYEGDAYSWGYNQGYGDYAYYISAPATGTLPSEYFHNSLLVLYPGTYYADHPSWYAVNEANETYGDNYAHWQLCYTGHGDSDEYDAMLNQAAEYVKNLYASRTNLNEHSFLFGTMDNGNRCHCSACEAAISKYGSITGSVVNFINDLRDLVIPSLSESEQKEASLGFFAYQSYEAAPLVNGTATIQMKDNVFCLVAPISANYTYPLTDSINLSTRQAFENWAKVGNLSAWLYNTNFCYYLYPLNSFEASHDSLVYLNSIGVKMVYLQGQHTAANPRTGFNAFKKFLAGQTMMDVSQSYSSLKDEFFSSYYGEAGDIMEGFFDEMVSQLKAIEENSSYHDELYSGYNATVYEEIANAKFWGFDLLKGWVDDCDTAYAKASSTSAKKHIKTESIFPRMALCELYDASYWSSEDELTSFRKSFKADCEELGISLYNEPGKTLASYYESWGIA